MLRRDALTLAVFMILLPAAPSAWSQEAEAPLTVIKLGENGPLEMREGDQPILRYNYQVVSEPPEIQGQISAGNRKYAVARSDYIHPLYGPNGEILTLDWPPDHPHHRGIYWAWPEVDWKGQRGDLHALQKVFARPTGSVHTEQGPGFAQITAENQWCWEDGTPIVREEATIRAGRETASGRCIDLAFRFTALGTDVLLARREQTLYGGLNVRLAPAQDQQITVFTDTVSTTPRRACAHRGGVPLGGGTTVGLTILQHHLNPDYPGDWIQFPDLSWVQPTFPASGTRYPITRDRPLVLRYRLCIHEGKLGSDALAELEASYQAQP